MAILKYKYNSSLLIMFIVAVCIPHLLIGCATNQRFLDEGTNTNDIAVLHRTTTAAAWVHRPNIVEIDGKLVGDLTYTKFELSPGRHRIYLVCEPAFTTVYTKFPRARVLEIDMKAGHQYQARCDITDGRANYWIEDVKTGAVMASIFSDTKDPLWQIKRDARTYCPNADNGQADAQLQIGHIYYEGNGIQKDLVQAYVWYSLSAKGGNIRAKDQLSAISQMLSQKQAAEARKRLDEWSPGKCQSDLLESVNK